MNKTKLLAAAVLLLVLVTACSQPQQPVPAPPAEPLPAVQQEAPLQTELPELNTAGDDFTAIEESLDILE